MKNIYIFTKLSTLDFFGLRIGGAGLGNILFPWARSVIASKKYALEQINPTWKSLKLGPLLRGEMDTRGYSDLFIDQNISGITKFFILFFGKRIPEEMIKEELQKKLFWPRVIVFNGMLNQANDILDEYDLVKNELIKMTHPKHLKAIEVFSGKGITIHIRLGDFYTPSSEDEVRSGKTNCRLPLAWYIAVIKKFRDIYGEQVPINVFSDGSDGELKDILDIPNVTRYYYGSAIADILAIAKSEVFIASNSTFSLWGSYLGRMPTIWFPGTLRTRIYKNPDEIEIEIDYKSDLPDSLKKYLNEYYAIK